MAVSLFFHIYILATPALHRCHESLPNRFMDICRSLPIAFEGGFFGDDPAHPHYEAFKHLVIHRKYGLDSYSDKMTRSAFAFNTPAVPGSHWR